MGYRGDDLDLRTPQARGGQAADRSGGSELVEDARGRADVYGSPRGGPIWVDETVMACCNHAFDVALAHRADEVGVVHLLYALTRIDAAAEILERFGVREAGLRRECATMIASEIPTGISGAAGPPRRAAALEEALRLAAAYSYRRNKPASVEDLLHVFFDLKPDLAGLELLHRHTPMVGGKRVEAVTPPAFTGYSEESARADVRRAAANTAREVSSPAPTLRQGLSNNPTDTIQNSRLDALEQMVRSLGADLSAERKTFSGVLESLQNNMGSLEERVVVGGAAGGAGGEAVSLQLAEFGERLGAIEGMLRSVKDGGGVTDLDLGPVSSRLDLIEEALLGEGGADTSKLGDRLAGVEQAVKNDSEVIREGLAGVSSDLRGLVQRLESPVQELAKVMGDQSSAKDGTAAALADVHEAIVKLNANQHALADSMSEWRKEGSDDRAALAERLAKIDEANTKTIAHLKSLASNMDAMYRVTVERYHRRNRFFYWLFGTDDWIGSSWPSQAAKVEEELKAMQRTVIKAD